MENGIFFVSFLCGLSVSLLIRMAETILGRVRVGMNVTSWSFVISCEKWGEYCGWRAFPVRQGRRTLPFVFACWTGSASRTMRDHRPYHACNSERR